MTRLLATLTRSRPRRITILRSRRPRAIVAAKSQGNPGTENRAARLPSRVPASLFRAMSGMSRCSSRMASIPFTPFTSGSSENVSVRPFGDVGITIRIFGILTLIVVNRYGESDRRPINRAPDGIGRSGKWSYNDGRCGTTLSWCGWSRFS